VILTSSLYYTRYCLGKRLIIIIGNQHNSRPTTNIDTTLDIDDEQHYLRITRYCNVRIESILLDVNEKKS